MIPITFLIWLLTMGSVLLSVYLSNDVQIKGAVNQSVDRDAVPVILDQNQTGLKDYNSSNFGWKIVYPVSWTLHETCCKGDHGFIILRDPNNSVTLQLINNSLPNSRADILMGEQQKLINNSAREDEFEFKILSSNNLTLANHSVREDVYVYNPLECGAPPQITATYCEYYQEPGSKLLYEMTLTSDWSVTVEYYSEHRDAFLQNLDTARRIINSSSIN